MTKENNKAKKSLWETTNRSFLGDLNFGKMGEERIARHLKSYSNVTEVRDISNSKRGIADDIDFEVVYVDGHISTLEVKTDSMAHRTGNIAYEEFSHKNPGCFARTKADHILYMLYETGEVYILNPDRFREYIAEMKVDAVKAKELGVRATRMGQGASGYLVPIKSIEETDIVECKFVIAA